MPTPQSHATALTPVHHPEAPLERGIPQGARGDWALGGLVAALIFGIYAWTLPPSVMGGDSGELIGVSLAGGVPHPPGYPLYTLLLRLLMALSPLRPVVTANAFSAVTGALAAGCLTATLRRLTGQSVISLVLGLLWALHPVTWEYALQAEVFTLNALFVGITAYLAAVQSQDPRWGRAWVLALLLGLAMTHHHTFVFWGAPLGLWLCWTYRSEPLRVLLLILAPCLGLLPYLYLPWSAQRSPSLGWGDLTHWSGVLHHILRRDYGTFRLGAWTGGSSFGQQILLYLRYWTSPTVALPLIVVPVLAVGTTLWSLRRGLKAGPVLFWAAVAWVTSMIVFHGLANPRLDSGLQRGVLSRFWIMPNWLAVLLAGWAMATLDAWRPWLTRVILSGTVIWAVAKGPVVNHGENRYLERISTAVFKVLPPNSILLVDNDAVYSVIRYHQLADGQRPDVTVLNLYLMTYPWYASYGYQGRVIFPGLTYRLESHRPDSYELVDFLDANIPLHSIYVFGGVPPSEDEAVRQRYYGLASGVLLRLLPQGSFPQESAAAWLAQSRAVLHEIRDLAQPDQFTETSWEKLLAVYVEEAFRRHEHLEKDLRKQNRS